MNRLNIKEKIESIEYNRNEAMKLIRKSLIDSCNVTIKAIDKLVLDDNTDGKTSSSLLKVKQLFLTLVDEIIFANNMEDIAEIRKKINYYLSKIKKEIETRQIEEKIKKEYYTSLLYFRDDLKEYFRCLKRKSNIDKIKSSYKENLDKEEKKELNYSISKEKKFNNRIFEKYNNPRILELPINIEDYLDKPMREITPEDVLSKLAQEQELTDEFAFEEIEEDLQIEEQQEIMTETSKDFEFERLIEEPLEVEEQPKLEIKPVIMTEVAASLPCNEEKIFINSRMLQERTKYVLAPTKEYNGSFISNIRSLINNIPSYMHNKRIVKLMKLDFANYNSGRALSELIDVTKKNNSISRALKVILNGTKLYRTLGINSLALEKEQNDLTRTIDIMEEYNNHYYGESSPTDFEYESIRSSKKESKKEVIEGEMDFIPLTTKRLSLR